MELQTQKKTWHSHVPKGEYRLKYIVTNSQGAQSFGGRHLPSFPSPFTGKKSYLKNADDGAENGWIVDKISTKFLPEENEYDMNKVLWMICHPEVKLIGFKDIDKVILDKKVKAVFELTCTTFQDIERFDNEDVIDRVVGKLSYDAGASALKTSQLRFILASIGKGYRDNKFADNPTAERKSLRTSLKTFAKKSVPNSLLIRSAIANLGDAEQIFLFKEMISNHIITFRENMYRFGNTPLGSSQERVLNFFAENEDVRNECVSKLSKKR